MEHPQREAIADLQKASPEYIAHAEVIANVLREAQQKRFIINRILAAGRTRAASAGRPTTNLPSLDALDKPTHWNCQGTQILFHHVGMEAFNKQYGNEDEAAELWPLLHRVASIRLSVMQFEHYRKPVDFTRHIRELDEKLLDLAPDSVEVPSITPHLFKPQTAMSQLTRILGKDKFADPDITANMAELYGADEHVLHSACMGLIAAGAPEVVREALAHHATQKYPQMKQHALFALFQQSRDLFTVFIISLVDNGNTEEALKWCDRQSLKPFVYGSVKLAEKYAAALRNQGRFVRAMEFLQEVRDQHGLSDRALSTQYNMALQQNTNILPGKLNDLRPRT